MNTKNFSCVQNYLNGFPTKKEKVEKFLVKQKFKVVNKEILHTRMECYDENRLVSVAGKKQFQVCFCPDCGNVDFPLFNYLPWRSFCSCG